MESEAAAAATAAAAAAARAYWLEHAMDSESDDKEDTRKRRAPRRLRQQQLRKRNKTADAYELERDYARLAKQMLKCGDLMRCHAFLDTGSKPAFWYHDGKLWHHQFGKHGSSAGLMDALKNALVAAAAKGDLSIPWRSIEVKHAEHLLNLASNIMAAAAAGHVLGIPEVATAGTITDMRTKARRMLAMRGGCLELGGEEQPPRLLRPAPRDVLFLASEVMPAGCPGTMEELLAHGCDALLNVFKAMFGEAWPVCVDLVVRTLRGEPHKLMAIFNGPRSSFKSAVTFVLNVALGQDLCPGGEGVSPIMASSRWSALNGPEKAKLVSKFGRSILRLVDEANEKSRHIDYAAIKGEQSPYGTMLLPGAHHGVPAPVAPLYIVTTNKEPDSLWSDPSDVDTERVLVFDTSASLVGENVAGPLTVDDDRLRSTTRPWLISLNANPSDALRRDVSLQLACLVAGWGANPARLTAKALQPTFTLAQHRARRAAAQAEALRVRDEGDKSEPVAEKVRRAVATPRLALRADARPS